MSNNQEEKSLNELIRLDNRNAIVTGGATGIGAAITHRLAEAGRGGNKYEVIIKSFP